MAIDTSFPFNGSRAVSSGELTWAVLLRGPGYRRLGPDTYVAVEVPGSKILDIRAAAVRGGASTVVTGWSACVVLGLDVAPGSRPTEIAVPGRRLRPVPGTVARRQTIPLDHWRRVDGLMVTTPLRTAFDLAARTERSGLVDAVVAADALLRLDSLTGQDLAAFALLHPGARGVLRVAEVADLTDPRSESPPETRARLRIAFAGLPAPEVQYQVRDVDGHRIARVDLGWPGYRVAVEYDGKDHTQWDRRGRDVDRVDELRRAGWIVIVVTKAQLARPSWVTDRVSEALLSRGWCASPVA